MFKKRGKSKKEVKSRPEQEHIPMMFLPPGLSEPVAKHLVGIGIKLKSTFPETTDSLYATGLKVKPEKYFGLALTNAGFLSLIFSLLMFYVMFMQGTRAMNEIFGLTIAIFFGICMVFMLLYIRYPAILALKRAELIDQDLVFALKDLVLQISSGIVLYEAFSNLASSNYKELNKEFKTLISEINAGKSMIGALERLAVSTKSQYLKRTVWQIVNSLKSGSDLKRVLNRIINDLTEEQKTKIRNYARELNLWSLVYMLFAVAVPSIGSTMLVILSSFAGIGDISEGHFIGFVIISVIIQVILVGFVKSRRPAVGL